MFVDADRLIDLLDVATKAKNAQASAGAHMLHGHLWIRLQHLQTFVGQLIHLLIAAIFCSITLLSQKTLNDWQIVLRSGSIKILRRRKLCLRDFCRLIAHQEFDFLTDCWVCKICFREVFRCRAWIAQQLSENLLTALCISLLTSGLGLAHLKLLRGSSLLRLLNAHGLTRLLATKLGVLKIFVECKALHISLNGVKNLHCVVNRTNH